MLVMGGDKIDERCNVGHATRKSLSKRSSKSLMIASSRLFDHIPKCLLATVHGIAVRPVLTDKLRFVIERPMLGSAITLQIVRGLPRDRPLDCPSGGCSTRRATR